MKVKVYLNTLRQKGNLAYEYHPFHNYLTEDDLYLVDNKFLIPKGSAVNPKNGEILYTKKDNIWYDKRGEKVSGAIEAGDPSNLVAKTGSLIDLDTDKLNFDLKHPVELEILPSYDGSVNVIFNDDKNIPRLINSRFSVREKNTYEIVDRIGENDTNIYNSKTFEKDSSLYFQYNQNPTITYLGYVNGVFPVGLYCFYFTYCDADDNESDIIAETGVIPVFIGDDGNPFSMDGGIKNQLSNKGIKLKLSNIDKSYNYIKIYYVRYFADHSLNRVYECKKIYLKYSINSNTLLLLITGNEQAEDLDANILNISKFNPKHVLTLALCKNMLFFGNIVKNTDNYRELQDCALRIIPKIKVESLKTVNDKYLGDKGYYDSLNMYNKVGYFPLEYYRFGVVFIYLNGTLSNVYNTLGCTLEDSLNIECSVPLFTTEGAYYVRNYINVDDEGWINEYNSENSENILIENANAKGVCKINLNIEDNEIIGITFSVPEEVTKFLEKDLGIRGMFFVRQKCIPNIIALCYLLPMDDVLKAPVLKYKENSKDVYVTESFIQQEKGVNSRVFDKKDERKVTHDYKARLYKYENELGISGNAYAAICPDFLLNLPYYNQIFNGSEFVIKAIKKAPLERTLDSDRFYKPGTLTDMLVNAKVTICSVTEDVPQVAIKNKIYKLQAGIAEEAFKFGFASYDSGTYTIGEEVENSFNIVRGIYSPYLAVYSSYKLDTGVFYNICKENSEDIIQEFKNRMNSFEPFYAISDRYNFESLKDGNITCYRGDCFINLFTYRLNRNFNDPTLPNNDIIIDENTWRDHYKPTDPTEWTKISRSDLNAVELGSWITFKVRSAMNYALRSTDNSYVSEKALMGTPRSFYPRSSLLYRGANKLPDSYLFNDAYRATLGFKCYFTLDNVNYIKNTFSNRILYSAISIQDSFKNNYRDSLSIYYRDYSLEYGSIQKLVSFEGYLLVVFEHAIGIAVINERVLAGTGDGEPVFINTKNVLPEELTIISDTYGTLWGDSVVKSEAGYVYGVDTIAKKIWRVKGQNIEILSDFKVNEFLVNNITLGERENYPIIGLRNVKTHYNNNKKDIIFTFYDDIYKDEEEVWSLCYNELLDLFVTFYSWVPSFSENIDTQFFTFNRDTAKSLSLLNNCNYHVPDNEGVLLDTPILTTTEGQYNPITLYYRDKINYTLTQSDNSETVHWDLDYVLKPMIIVRDHWGAYNWFTCEYTVDVETEILNAFESFLVNKEIIYTKIGDKYTFLEYFKPSEFLDESKLSNWTTLLQVKSDKKLKVDEWFEGTNDTEGHPILLLQILPYGEKAETVALTRQDIVENLMLSSTDRDKPNLTTDFYLHGLAGIIDIKENVYPTHWYGKTHPFEFEFVVNDKIAQLKIFTNLVIIANKAEPESFHFEIEGDNYEFSSDKRNMYFRLEATKELYLNLGSDILYDRYYTDAAASSYTLEQNYRKKTEDYTNLYNKMDKVYPIESEGLSQLVKSTIFPLYYNKIDTYNDIYHDYQLMKGDMYDFLNLSGSEVAWNKKLNQFNIITHIKNNPIDKVGRLRGNSRYKEGSWNILIPSINFMLKNENPWPYGQDYQVPPIIINSQLVPNDLTDDKISADKLPNTYVPSKENPVSSYIDTKDWTYRKEARIRDKWMKVRVRYSGKNLAIIHSLITLYDISYS